MGRHWLHNGRIPGADHLGCNGGGHGLPGWGYSAAGMGNGYTIDLAEAVW